MRRSLMLNEGLQQEVQAGQEGTGDFAEVRAWRVKLSS